MSAATTERPVRVCRCCRSEWTQDPSLRATTNYCGFRGWCPRCYRRWLNHGKPLSGPPPVRRGSGGRGSCQLDDYEFLRSWGYTREQCAGRLGVTKRTIERYEARLRERREAITKGEAA